MKFSIICADPPWSFSDSLKAMKSDVKRSAESQYHVMTLDDIAAIDVKSVADPNGCLLALWVPGSMLADGMRVMQSWGFKHKQVFVWVKLKKSYKNEEDVNKITSVGMGRIFRQSHELALIGTSGKTIYPALEDHSQRSVAFDFNEGHSVKPPTLQDRLDQMFPTCTNKLEMFARRQRPGWTCVGDGVTGIDINTSIQELSKL